MSPSNLGLKLRREQRNLQVVEKPDPDPPAAPSRVVFAPKCDRDAMLHGFVGLGRSVQSIAHANGFRRLEIEGMLRNEIRAQRLAIRLLTEELRDYKSMRRQYAFGIRRAA